jgi:rubrerythrin
MVLKRELENFEIAEQSETGSATSKSMYSPENINPIDRELPVCFDCGSIMTPIPNGKYCPHCGRFVYMAHGKVSI